MSDVLPLPPRPNLERYKKLAKDFQRACRSEDPGSVRAWAAEWAETLARLQGRDPTPETRREIAGNVERVERVWNKVRDSKNPDARCSVTSAQFFLARCHGFTSWPKFAQHLDDLARATTPVSQFEAAVDAIVAGDHATLATLLREHPELARARSSRDHGSTLLHYVSANGVEDFRQKTPANIVQITKLLLDAGADVDAESGAYGGGSTTLGLTATSCHPEAAGVQLPLMDLLIRHGAAIDSPKGGSAVNDCLHNGRGEAARFFADRGARLDLEGAAGVGRLDVVKTFFDADGNLRPPATRAQMIDGFAWACEFGHTDVVDYLLPRGVPIDGKLRHDGQTGLHWAAWGGHVETVKLLLERGAPVEAKEASYGGTPLGWLLYRWGNAPELGESYYNAAALLARAGGTVDLAWFEVDDEDRRRAIRRVRSDERMREALGEQSPIERR